MDNVVTLHPDFITLLPLIIAFLTGVAGPIIVTFFKHKLFKRNQELKKRQKEFKTSLEVQTKINNLLNSLIEKYNLDRIWICQFHNGSNFYPGNKSMKKLSATFESCSPGVSTDIMRMQNLPISFFSQALQELNKEQSPGVTIDVFTTDDIALRNFWENRGVNTVYLFSIKDIENNFIGVLGVDFVKRDGYLTDSVYESLLNESKILAGYIAAISLDIEK